MDLKTFNLKEYMFHKRPMLLVDKILEESETESKTSFAVKQDNIFLDENNLLARSVLIEIAAQSFAATDIYQRTKTAKPLTNGFLVAVKDFKFFLDAKAGDEIICELEETNSMAGIHIVETQLYIDGVCAAKGQLRIFEMQKTQP